MHPSTALLHETTLDQDAAVRNGADRGTAVLERPDGLDRGARFPEPPVEKIRGPKLVALWIALAAGAWIVAAGTGYGFYVVMQALFF